MKKLKELRLEKGLTQLEASKILGISRRTYINYENNVSKLPKIKYDFLISTLNEYGRIDEDRGILSISEIKDLCGEVFKEYDIEYCYLFGSYAKGHPKENSDIDLLISTKLTGLQFFGLIERLKEVLKKRVDVLDVNQLNNNLPLIEEILKVGIKIYG